MARRQAPGGMPKRRRKACVMWLWSTKPASKAMSDMLRQHGRSLAEIALDAGFVDQSHMSHAFRQRFGMPPGAWRRRMFDGYKTAPQAGD